MAYLRIFMMLTKGRGCGMCRPCGNPVGAADAHCSPKDSLAKHWQNKYRWFLCDKGSWHSCRHNTSENQFGLVFSSILFLFEIYFS